MMCRCRFISCSKCSTWCQMLRVGEAVCVGGQGYMETLYFLLKFAVNLNCSKKISISLFLSLSIYLSISLGLKRSICSCSDIFKLDVVILVPGLWGLASLQMVQGGVPNIEKVQIVPCMDTGDIQGNKRQSVPSKYLSAPIS